MSARYAVVGNPISHSLSPAIHDAFARQTGQDIVYERLLSPINGFDRVIDAFWRSGGAGLNVTLPFKLAAYRLAQRHSARAVAARAANTLTRDVGPEASDHFAHPAVLTCADNTDGVGLVRDLRDNLGHPLTHRHILLIGAGGAARGVIGDILAERPTRLVLSNRTRSAAEALAAELAPPLGGVALEVFAPTELMDQRFDLVINATAASLSNALPVVPKQCFSADCLVYDMMYGRASSPFLDFAAAAGCRTVDGLGMLVEQAAASFTIWRGVKPTTGAVLAAMRKRLRQ